MHINQIPLANLLGTRKLSTRLARLAEISLFSQLTPNELSIIDGLLHHRDFLAGEIVFDEGEEGQAIYIVEDGEISIDRPSLGELGHVAMLKSGDFFGDMALLDNLPRAAQARASGPVRLAVFFRADFLALMDTHARIASKIALQMAREMGRRLRLVHSSEAQAWRQHL